MRITLLTATVLITILAVSCRRHSLSGIYVCDQSDIRPDTTIHHLGFDEKRVDTTIHHHPFQEIIANWSCTFTAFDFKGNTTVEIRTENGKIASSYVIDNVRIKCTGSDLLLKIQDENTLIGDGIA